MLFIGATLTTGFQATSLIGNPLKNRAPSAVMVHKYLDVPEARSAWLAKQEEPWGPKFAEMIGNVVPTNTDEAAAKAAWLAKQDLPGQWGKAMIDEAAAKAAWLANQPELGQWGQQQPVAAESAAATEAIVVDEEAAKKAWLEKQVLPGQWGPNVFVQMVERMEPADAEEKAAKEAWLAKQEVWLAKRQ